MSQDETIYVVEKILHDGSVKNRNDHSFRHHQQFVLKNRKIYDENFPNSRKEFRKPCFEQVQSPKMSTSL